MSPIAGFETGTPVNGLAHLEGHFEGGQIREFRASGHVMASF
jgi:hypothetical protein